MASNQTPELTQAFPEHLRRSVLAVLEAIPDGPSAAGRSPDDIGVIALNCDPLRIPGRIYIPEPDWFLVRSLGDLEQSIAACLYTRHHNGHVRERALAHIS